jgi:hypothetical protein
VSEGCPDLSPLLIDEGIRPQLTYVVFAICQVYGEKALLLL